MIPSNNPVEVLFSRSTLCWRCANHAMQKTQILLALDFKVSGRWSKNLCYYLCRATARGNRNFKPSPSPPGGACRLWLRAKLSCMHVVVVVLYRIPKCLSVVCRPKAVRRSFWIILIKNFMEGVLQYYREILFLKIKKELKYSFFSSEIAQF